MHRFSRAQSECGAFDLSSHPSQDSGLELLRRDFAPEPRAAYTKLPHSAVIAPRMRRALIAVLILLALAVAWFAWPFAGLYDLARAAQSRDVAKIEQRVDFASLGRSLSEQIVQTYSRLAGLPVERGSLVAGLASAIADPIIARLLTRVTLAELLENGWPKNVLGDPPPEFRAPNWNALGNARQLFSNSEYGITEFRLRLPVDASRERQFRIHLALRGLTWKLSGLDLPQELLERLAREVMKQQGKAG